MCHSGSSLDRSVDDQVKAIGMAHDGGWHRGAERSPEELSARGGRLEKSTTHMAAAECGPDVQEILKCGKSRRK